MLKIKTTLQKARSVRGFTLVEMMVSVAIFAVVMTISLGALLAMSESDRKAQTLKSVINNLNFSLDSMSRAIRTGTSYHCDVSAPTVNSLTVTVRDCAGAPGNSFAFRASGGTITVYRLTTSDTDATLCGQPTGRVGCIVRSTDGGSTYSALTSSEVYINTLSFYVTGATAATVQPKVTILISGVVTVTATQTSPFNLQTSVTQRLYDQ